MDEPKRYESLKHFVGVSGFVINVLILIFLLISGWSARIRSFAEMPAGSGWLSVLIYMIIIGAIFKVFDLPLSFYSGYILEHRFGLSRQSLGSWIKDQLKGLAIGVPLTVAAVEVVYLLLRADSDSWWIYASLAFIAFVIVMANLAPVLLLPLFFKFKPVDSPDLESRVDRL